MSASMKGETVQGSTLDVREKQDEISSFQTHHSVSNIFWLFAIVCLVCVAVLCGTPNLFPSQRVEMIQHFGFSGGQATFFLTGGTFLTFLSLPSGIFLDKFGSTLTYFLSIILAVFSYIILCILLFVKQSKIAFIIFYLLMAFGSSSLFNTILQIIVSHSPPKFFGLSMSVVSASMSFSYGFCSIIYKYFAKIFGCSNTCTVSQSMAGVAIFVSMIFVVFGPLAFFFFHKFCPPKSTIPESDSDAETKMESTTDGQNDPSQKSGKKFGFLRSFFTDRQLYILIALMFMGVFAGQMIISAGQPIWIHYGYPDGAFDYSLLFSIFNSTFTIVLSILLDYLIVHKQWTRAKGYAIFTAVFALLPFFVMIVFLVSKSKILFGVATSTMGIPFGFSLTHIPALTAHAFGPDRFGVAFGFVQIGSLVATAIALPMMTAMSKNAIAVLFAVVGVLYLAMSVVTFFFMKPAPSPLVSDGSSDDEKQAKSSISEEENSKSSTSEEFV